uniref:Cytoplasmic linker associated protein 1 n=1 Tax=Oncorhynchus mykiss TaxID=8022 RepID=A0A8L0DRG2_ONCMY
MEVNMEYCLAQVVQKDLGRKVQVGQELIDYILDKDRSQDLEQDQTGLDRMVDSIATTWVNCSNFKVALLGIDLLSVLVTRLQDRFRNHVGTVLPSLIDRLGDSKDQVRDQDQILLLKIMEQAATPQYVWDRMLGGFKHKNNRTREGVCLCLISTLNMYGAQGLTLSKIVPHICNLLGDPTSQVRDGAMGCLVEIYRHVGERVRMDLSKKGLPQSRLNVIFSRFDEVQRSGNMIPSSDKNFDDEDSVDGGRSCSSASSSKAPPTGRRTVAAASVRRPSSATGSGKISAKDAAAGAVDEEDFIKAFEEVPTIQIHSNREMEENLSKVREVLSDDKNDWEHRVIALKKVRSLLLAGALEYESFPQQLRLLEAPLKLSAKDLRSQVVREACITLGHWEVENNLYLKTCGTSSSFFQHTHYSRLIPIITSNCTSKSVAVRRKCVLTVLCYWGFHGHYSREAEHLFQALESTYQKALQSHLKSSDSVVSLHQSDRSSSSSQESLNSRVNTNPGGSLQRSRSDIDVNAAASAKSCLVTVPSASPFSSAATLPPGSYASLDGTPGKINTGRVRTRRTSAGSAVGASATVTDSRGRSRAKMVSQSQRSRSANPTGAGSRSSSPGKLLGHSSGYGRISRPPSASSTPADKRSKVPRSQGCSRDSSPSRLGLARSRIPRPSMSQGCSRDTSRESSRDTSPARGFKPLDRFGLIHQDRISASVNAMRVLNTGTEVEAAVADALLLGDSRNNKRKPMRRRYESPGIYSDDDANSDASSACSERSYGSRNGGIPHYLRQTEDVAEVLNHCASSNWSERKEGLLGLQNLLKNQRILSRVELKRLCEIFSRMFADPHSKVFSMFLETLLDFILVHREDLQDWLFVLLTQLLKKMGADLLGSVQAKVQKALDITRYGPLHPPSDNISKHFHVKVAILKYIESLARQMDPTDFVNSSETRLAVSRIITWTTEPKSSDVRKAAQVVLISLFELNTPEFTMLLGALPKTFQDGATKLLQNHLKNSSNTSSVSSPSNTIGRTPSRHPPSRTSPLTSPTNCSHGGLSPSRLWGGCWSGDGLPKHPPPPHPPPPHSTPAGPALRVLRRAYSPSMLEYDTENMNSDEIYSSLRGVTEAIQSFSYRSQEDLNELRGKRDDAAGREGVAPSPGSDARLGLDVVEGGRTALDNKTSLLNTPSPRSFSGPRTREFAPYGYGDTITSSYDKSALKEAVFDDDVEQFRDCSQDHSDLVADLLKELSNHNERVEERKGALVELLKITREDSLAVWDEHFKTILLLLLETLGDKDYTIRAMALRVLKEILRNQPARFKNYAELTIMKTLEAHKDSHKEVVRAAEESASTLAGSIHPEQCIKVLCPIVQTADYPINLAAIKMQTKVIERITKESLHQLLPDIIPGLLQGYDNTESSVRKASVFCLVAIYSVIGEELKPHLQLLTGSKMKLLNLYIKRAQTTNSNSSSSSDVSSHS